MGLINSAIFEWNRTGLRSNSVQRIDNYPAKGTTVSRRKVILKGAAGKDIPTPSFLGSTGDISVNDKMVGKYDDVEGKAGNGLSLGRIFSLSIVIVLVAAQIQRNYFISDQSQALHFRRYAAAILAPLPPGAVLLVNYDMQWTSIRYLQKCEGVRADVTAINLSMMTYSWFKHKHALYPQLTFPGTYHAAPNSPNLRKEGAFTMAQFLDANVGTQGSRGKATNNLTIFLGGKFSFKDPKVDERYELEPVGLVSQITPRSVLSGAEQRTKRVAEAWTSVLEALPNLPDEAKYPQETWEWTIGRDFKDRVADTAAYLLEGAIAGTTTAPSAKPLLYAVYWLESALLLESGTL
eukprot:gene1191-1345_t